MSEKDLIGVERALAQLAAEEAAARPEPSDALFARVLADAERQMPPPVLAQGPMRPSVGRGDARHVTAPRHRRGADRVARRASGGALLGIVSGFAACLALGVVIGLEAGDSVAVDDGFAPGEMVLSDAGMFLPDDAVMPF